MNAIPEIETPQAGARRLFAREIGEGFEPVSLHCYAKQDGEAAFYRPRLKHPDGRKVIRPMRLDGLRFVLGEPKAPKGGKVLYRLPELIADPAATVWIVEGESCADALAQAGKVATTSGGASSADAADWSPLRGRSVIVWPDNDGPGANYADAVAANLEPLGCAVQVVDVAALDLPDGGDVVDWLAGHPADDLDAMPLATQAPDSPLVQLTQASTIKCIPIRWLWRDWLARGKLHILAGAPGTGKTTIALAMAAVVTRGGQWPDGTAAPPGRVLLWSGEDDPADTLVPRLRAAGADLDRVLIVGDALTGDEPRPFDPAQDLAALEWQLERYDDIALLIADPVVSAIGGADSHKNTEVRRALQPLVNLGQRLGCAVLGISHFSKGTAGRDPTERVTGSVAFGALARVVLVTAKAEDGGRLLARSKSNIGPDGGGFAYGLEMTREGGMEASRVSWGDVLEGTARELLGDAEAVADSPRDDAAAWLTDALSGAEVPVTEIKAEARGAGLSWRTIERAKAEIGVIARRVNGETRGAGYWTWELPIKSATINTANPNANVGGLEETAQRRGFSGDSTFKAANPESGGLGAVLNDAEARERILNRFGGDTDER